MICTLSAVLCIPEGEGIHKTALRVQITYTLEAMVQLTCTIVLTVLKWTPQLPSNAHVP